MTPILIPARYWDH